MKTCVGVEVQVLNLGTIGSFTAWPLCAQSKGHWCSLYWRLGGFRVSLDVSGVPRNFVRGGGSTNSGEDRGQRERGSGGVAP